MVLVQDHESNFEGCIFTARGNTVITVGEGGLFTNDGMCCKNMQKLCTNECS